MNRTVDGQLREGENELLALTVQSSAVDAEMFEYFEGEIVDGEPDLAKIATVSPGAMADNMARQAQVLRARPGRAAFH